MRGKVCPMCRWLRWSKDHPRTCGEKVFPAVCLGFAVGSPPHMRGKEENMENKQQGRRITPAHAGKSAMKTPVSVMHQDHPRTCGEKQEPDSKKFAIKGSPPHMRGKAPADFSSSRNLGITPAHAGKRYRFSLTRNSCRDHPRTCGEKRPAEWKLPTAAGSPPHMRGKVPAHRRARTASRITPAHAGKSICGPGYLSFGKDHPRTCGEKYAISSISLLVRGSPPHMRGKAEKGHRAEETTGITPAHAGKSTAFPTISELTRDHPRTCGEKIPGMILRTGELGSPPHMRGKVSIVVPSVITIRITPAHAGKRQCL